MVGIMGSEAKQSPGNKTKPFENTASLVLLARRKRISFFGKLLIEI
jgi:hypothetical protein